MSFRKRTYGPTLYARSAKRRRMFLGRGRRRGRRGGKRSRGGTFKNYQMSIMRVRGFAPPLNMRLKMAYEDTWSETTAGGFIHYLYRGNDAFDPDVSGAGGTASGLQQWSYIYRTYRVIGSSIMIEVINNDADDAVRFAVYPTYDTAAVAVANKDGIAGIPGCSHGVAINQTGSHRIFNRALTNRVFGIKYADDVGFRAATGATPTHVWYWDMYFHNHTANALNCEVRVRLVFDVILSSPYNQQLADVS